MTAKFEPLRFEKGWHNNLNMRHLQLSLKKVYQRLSFIILTLLFFFIFLLLDYFLLTRTTTWESFLVENNRIFVYLTLVFGIINNILIAVSLTFLVYVFEQRKKLFGGGSFNSVVGVFLSLVSVGCAVCGGFLLPIVGIAASLTAFPFQGLEIKAFSIVLLAFSINQTSLRIAGIFSKPKNWWQKNYPYVLGLAVLIFIYILPRLPWQFRRNFFGAATPVKPAVSQQNTSIDAIFNAINPEKGYELNASFGDLGPKMVAAGVIDLDKFKEVYNKSGQPLTSEQLNILTQGSNQKIRITRENSYFLLNFFWAAGLANKSKILTEGDMVKYGKDQIGNFASTGGWSLAKGNPMDYYAKSDLISLTDGEEAQVFKVASNIYRPCCNNSTAFPDCNHGIALLAVLQLLASNGATENQMYEAGKYFNAFWFPSNYYDLALYFKNAEGKTFAQVPGQVILGKNYSSATGWQSIKKWLADRGIIQPPPKQGGGCGV